VARLLLASKDWRTIARLAGRSSALITVRSKFISIAAIALGVSIAPVLAPLGAGVAATGTSSSIAACALGGATPGLGNGFATALDRATAVYAATLGGDSAATKEQAKRTFAAAAAAYAYGMPQEILLQTIKGYLHNEIINVNALATPSTQGVVSPNVDTAYSVAWIDLTTGPVIINVPNTGGRFYTFQFMDAYTNAFAYVGSGSTGTRAGAYALVPPGWSGTLPTGVTEIKSPTNTVWLLGRTLVDGASDFPAVKQIQEQYTLTPLVAWETGVREPPVTISSYPSGKKKSLPSGTAFISTLNQELTIDPPPAADDCALEAMAPAGVVLPHPTPAQSDAADLANIAGETPPSDEDAATTAAVDAGVAAGSRIVAEATSKLLVAEARGNHGWDILNRSIGTYGTDYLARAIIATGYLGANIPSQGLYPVAYFDVAGRTFDGADRYTITFPRGLLPPARAFWSLTMYDSDNYLYANALNRYEIGNRTAGLVYGRSGSLTVYISHTEPASPANWLPAPSGTFHMILRLYQPTAAALDETWKPPPVFRTGEVLRPVLSRLRVANGRLRYLDSQAANTRVTIYASGRLVARFIHRDRAGENRVSLGRFRLRSGRYRLVARAIGVPASYDNASGRAVSLGFRAG
jgi:hypothetical protein